ncbi:MAG: TonB C-terminal domain-containing protein [Mariprofundaceae bacterium]|nr:TonB C-terminal domain-containing protein [Mariprofundaceae bacterium]
MQAKAKKNILFVAFVASIAAHIVLVLFISLNHNEPRLVKKQAPQFTDVILLDENTKSKKSPPKDAKTIANRSAQGGSSHAKDRSTRTAKSSALSKKQSKQRPTPPQAPKVPPVPPKSSDKRTRIITKKGTTPEDNNVIEQAPFKKKTIAKQRPTPPRQIPLSKLMPSSMALSELSRDFERERRMKQMLSKEADIPINTKEAKYAPYAHSLVRALEEQWRPGQADYQKFVDSARQVLMRVTIEMSGELGNLEILRPSPIQSLNESAIRAIHDAAPFKPLPSSWGLDRASFYLTFEVVDDQFVFRTM